jgi:hypothetical protein
LFQHLAAVTQALAFLELVKKSESFTGQIGDELKAAFSDKPAPIGTLFVAAVDTFGCLHRSPPYASN